MKSESDVLYELSALLSIYIDKIFIPCKFAAFKMKQTKAFDIAIEVYNLIQHRRNVLYDKK